MVRAERAEAVTVLLLAIADVLSPTQRGQLGTLTPADDSTLADELINLRAQLFALSALGR